MASKEITIYNGGNIGNAPMIEQTIIETPPIENEVSSLEAGPFTFDYGNPMVDAVVAIALIGTLYIGKKIIDKVFR